MNAAIQAILLALKIAESNAQSVQEPYIGFFQENNKKIVELKAGLARLGGRFE